MNSLGRVTSLLCGCLVLLAALGIHSPQGVAGQTMAGTYKVTDTTDLGMQVRVTMQIRLMNAGEDKLFVTEVRLRGFPRPARNEGNPAGVILEPHGSSEFTQEFTIEKQEYELWNKGARPRLGLKVRAAGGAEITMTIALMPQQGSR
jgi:hypothetical protein